MIDPFTKTEFTPSRSNQKFSSPRNRNAYHNRKATAMRKSIANINKPLHKNLQILRELLPVGIAKKEVIVHEQFLAGRGYNFSVITHLEEYEKTRRWAIYDYLVIPLEGKNYKIILNSK